MPIKSVVWIIAVPSNGYDGTAFYISCNIISCNITAKKIIDKKMEEEILFNEREKEE